MIWSKVEKVLIMKDGRCSQFSSARLQNLDRPTTNQSNKKCSSSLSGMCPLCSPPMRSMCQDLELNISFYLHVFDAQSEEKYVCSLRSRIKWKHYWGWWTLSELPAKNTTLCDVFFGSYLVEAWKFLLSSSKRMHHYSINLSHIRAMLWLAGTRKPGWESVWISRFFSRLACKSYFKDKL